MTPSIRRTAALLAGLCAAAGASAATSTFDSSTEGWTAVGDFAAPVTWSASGGNPGGQVAIPDSVSGGITYFVAPAAFLGNQSAALGTSLTFDLKQTYPGAANQFDAADVVLVGGGLTLVHDTAGNPPNGSWASYSVPLVAAGWHVGTLTGSAATAAQMTTALGNLTALRIRAEYQTGSDTGYLDNVTLAAVPEPATNALMALGGVVLMLAARRRQR